MLDWYPRYPHVFFVALLMFVGLLAPFKECPQAGQLTPRNRSCEARPRPQVFGMVFAASNVARLLLPLRFGAALAMAPWVDENIMLLGTKDVKQWRGKWIDTLSVDRCLDP